MTAANIVQRVNELKVMIDLLKRRCQTAETRLAELDSQYQQSQQQVADLEKECSEWKTKYKNLRAGTAEASTDEERQEQKERYLALIREIDDCIAKLNG